MNRILICLIGKRTTHNVQFIKYFDGHFDQLIFLTTSQMEQSNYCPSNWIMDSLGLEQEDVEKILISAYDIKLMEEVLTNHKLDKEASYYVNITGGNKLMSLFAFQFFQDFNAKQFFFPENQDYFLELGKEKIKIPLMDEMTLKEYVRAHGLKIFESERKIHSMAESKRIMRLYIQKGGNMNKMPSIKFAQRNKRNEDKVFYSGGWYEEYIYGVIKRELNIPPSQIAMKVKIEGQYSTNEYDVVFVKDDKIYVVECKAYFGKGNLKNKLEQDLYKLAALDDEFGMRSRSLYFTTFDIAGRDAHVNKIIAKRAKDLGVKIFQMNDMIEEKFIQEMKTWFK